MVSASFRSAIQGAKKELGELNALIHSNPELGYQEHKAHNAFVATLEKLGFSVTPHAYGVPTSFEAEYGHGGRLVVFNAEYDALPGIGHACGHNLMGTLSLAAFLAIAAELKASGLPGRVRVLGTPAEEGGAGKALLICKGAYESVDACFMAHPAPLYAEYSEDYHGMAFMPNLSVGSVRISFTGKEAHAGFAPWQGINALDAVVLGYSGVSMMRQQIEPTERVHGIIVNGGVKNNIIPNHSVVDYAVRAPSISKTIALRERLIDCYEGAAKATHCQINVERGRVYAELQPNQSLCALFAEVVGDLGIPMMCDFKTGIVNGGATDQGNVSYVVPSIHPVYGIQAGVGEFNHTVGFTKASGTKWALDRSLLVAEGLASTAWKVLADDVVASRVREEFEKTKRGRIAAGEDVSTEFLGSFDEDAFIEAGIAPVPCSCGHGK
ncbi:hypothetical protein BP6252_10768 [Coleophoma cylindrospora]|uniref:Peptidase M20 domain-containing protein 2 n=1 Tax=Coleophoma cylindrospora TaxID=1849047 RepID=A0A3D8QTL1_9HELO|nr:hypothetical protein BP6252_10768 [Coleophoma cylindrospora]